jgi:hypothetical protein
MAKDLTLQERFESVLYHWGVKESGAIAEQLHEEYRDWVENVFPSQALEILDRVDNE